MIHLPSTLFRVLHLRSLQVIIYIAFFNLTLFSLCGIFFAHYHSEVDDESSNTSF